MERPVSTAQAHIGSAPAADAEPGASLVSFPAAVPMLDVVRFISEQARDHELDIALARARAMSSS